MTSFKTLSVYMYVCTLVILLNMDWCLLLSGYFIYWTFMFDANHIRTLWHF